MLPLQGPSPTLSHQPVEIAGPRSTPVVVPGLADGPPAGNSSSPAGTRGRGADLQAGKLLALVVFVGLSLLSYKYVHNGQLAAFVLRIQENPVGSLHLFIAFHILAVVLLFPAMLLQAITGALYGLYVGLALSWFASSVGQALAFLLGRYLFRASVKAYLLQRVPNFPQIEMAIKKEGWKLMCLLRLSPILPYNILNYAAALTPISFLAYTLSSALAIIPWTVLYVYLGTLSTSVVAELARGKFVTQPQVVVGSGTSGHEGGGMRLQMLLSSTLYCALLAVTIVYGYVLSKRAITSVLKSVADQGPGSGSEPAGSAGGSGGGSAADVELASGSKG